MEREQFDDLIRRLAAARPRRTAIGALLGVGLAGVLGPVAANKNGRKRKRSSRKRQATLAAEAAACQNPVPSSNLNGCNFNNREFVGEDLSSTSMRGTRFRGANLCGADLSSSQLKDADFRGFPAGQGSGNPTVLFRADLSSSGCNGTRFNTRTLFCRTRTCNGSIRDDDCPAGVDPQVVCCADGDCPEGERCQDGSCVGRCPHGWIPLPNDSCAFPCASTADCGFGPCVCAADTEAGAVCVDLILGVACVSGDFTCRPGEVCEGSGCHALCGPPIA